MSTSSYTRMAQFHRQNEDNDIRKMNTLLSEQTAQLSRWSTVAKTIIKEVCSLREDDLEEDVTSDDLAMVLGYLRLMRSSVLMYQDLNEALRNRVDELLEISAQDGQCLGDIVDHFHTMPVMDILSASRDNQTNNLILNVQLNGEASSNQVRSFRVSEPLMLTEQNLAEHELNDGHCSAQEQLSLPEQQPQGQVQEQEEEVPRTVPPTRRTTMEPQGRDSKASWIERGLSFLVCASVATLLAKTSFFGVHRRHRRS